MSIDIFIIISFLVFTLIVGLKHSNKAKTIQDYATGGRNFSTTTLVATIVATIASGSSFTITLSKVYSNGLYYLIASSGIAVSIIIMSTVFVPKMQSFLGKNSIAEAIGDLYGDKIRIITAICGIIRSTGMIAVQFQVFGSICNSFLGIPPNYSVITAGLIVTFYSSFGGIRSVTFTDVLQMATFGIAIPLVGVMIWQQFHYDGYSFVNSLIDNKFNPFVVFDLDNPKLLQVIPLMLYFAIPGMDPSSCQRILMGKNIAQVKQAFIISAIILLIIRLMISWIPFLIFNVNSHLNSNNLLSYIVDNYTYVGLKGLIIVGVVSMSMSTADSLINASSVLFSYDICRVLNIGKNKELFLSKIFSLVAGVFGIYLALAKTDLLSIILAANSFYMPIVTVPIMLSILGFRTSSKSILTGMLAGFITVISWKILQIEINCIVVAMVINLLSLFGSHYLLKQPGGWTKRIININ